MRMACVPRAGTSTEAMVVASQLSGDIAILDAGRTILVDLIRACAKGDRGALDRLHKLTAAKTNGVVLRFIADRATAEEVLQDVYVDVWRRAERYDPAVASPITWIAAIARNRAIDRLRAERSRGAGVNEALDGHDFVYQGGGADEAIIGEEESVRLRRCLACLQPDQERAIRAAFFRGERYEDLANREKVPLSTMKSRIRRSLHALRACLEREQ